MQIKRASGRLRDLADLEAIREVNLEKNGCPAIVGIPGLKDETPGPSGGKKSQPQILRAVRMTRRY